MNRASEDVRAKLFALKDEEYKEFNAKLIPSVCADKIIGVRTPVLRKFAKELKKEKGASEFLKDVPHEYYEENNLHAFLIAEIKDYEECVKCVNSFLPCVDNWATCDCFKPKCFEKNKDKLLNEIKKWLNSDYEYTVRFGVSMLMTHFLDGDFKSEFLNLVADIKKSTYYIDMMCAWYFATALAKQWNDTVKFLEKKRLSVFIHNKTIQKAKESYRISEENKRYLEGLKIK